MRNRVCWFLLLVSLGGHAQDLPQALTRAITDYTASAAAPLIERANFFPDAMVPFAHLSPDGRFVAAGIRDDGTRRMVLLDTATLEEKPLFANDRIRSIEWSKDSRRLFVALAEAVGVVAPEDPTHASYITRLDQRTEDVYLGPADRNGEHILVVRKRNGVFQLEKVALDGTEEVLFESADKIDQALAGSSGNEFYLVLHDSVGRRVVHLFDGALELVYQCGLPELNACELLDYDSTGQTLWLNLHGDRDKSGLYAWSAVDRSLSRMHEDPLDDVDLDSVVFREGRPLAVSYIHGSRDWYALDTTTAPVLADAIRQMSATASRFSIGANGVWLARVEAAVLRESHYFLSSHGETSREILQVPGPTPTLDPGVLSTKIAFAYTASDGRRIPVYVSLPRGTDIAQAPLVALIHGGPWSRVSANYESMIQLLANRGYVVFQPNFRASLGYGKAHVLAANQDFGDGRVQRDITEGVEYLVGHGIGHRDKVGIVGGSFGGFAVLSGLAFNPQLYRVGVAMVPPADLGYALASLQQPGLVRRQPSVRELLRVLGGDYDDPAVVRRLYQKSPLAHLDNIQAPLLISAGADDNRVDIRHVKDYALRLLNAGKQMALLIDENEGHGFLSDEASEVSMYLTELMLSQYLGGRIQPLNDPILQHYLDDKVLLNTIPAFLESLP